MRLSRKLMLMMGGGNNTYDGMARSLNPLLHFPLTEESGTAAVNYGTLGTDGNGAYHAVVAKAMVKAPGGGWAPYWSSALSAAQNINIYSAVFAAAFNQQLFSVVIWWMPESAAVWTDGNNHYIYAISSEFANQIYILKTTVNGTIQNLMLNEGTSFNNGTTGHSETGWMMTVHTVSKAANEFKSYENGNLVGTKAMTKTWTAALAATECRIGNGRNVGTAWAGYISRFSVYGKVLSQAEITALYNKGIATLEAMPTNRFSADRATSALTIPTYDESGEALHPSVYYNASGWNGYKYWMVMTPYTASNGLVENPSIVVSDDGITWEVPAGLTNPIYPYTNTGYNGYNSDPELTMVGATLYVTFRDASDTTHFYYKQISSTDGITWTAAGSATDLFMTASHNEEVSPSIVYANGKFYMFTVLYHDDTNTSSLRRRECATINGTWSDPTDVTYSSVIPSVYWTKPWHIGVIKLGERLLMAVSTLDRHYIYMMQSHDYGLTWELDPWPMLSRRAAGQWDDTYLYRPCMAQVGSDLVLWYGGGKTVAGPAIQWGTGRTIITEP